ncbi:hypothetical protein HanPI659440_Chr08g0309951 [Helianthus annuus]|nr:hypothetical protein HanPI659440_Chr08g0309951 [Helianthus annuus]
MRKNFAELDNVVDMKQPTIIKSSNVDGNVVANKFVDGHLHNFTHSSNESVMVDKMFVYDHFQKLTNISDETGNVCNKACIFRGLPDLTMSSIESAKNKDKGFDMEFGALVGVPDKYMTHEMNKLRKFKRGNQRAKALKNWKWDEVIEIDSFGQDS